MTCGAHKYFRSITTQQEPWIPATPPTFRTTLRRITAQHWTILLTVGQFRDIRQDTHLIGRRTKEERRNPETQEPRLDFIFHNRKNRETSVSHPFIQVRNIDQDGPSTCHTTSVIITVSRWQKEGVSIHVSCRSCGFSWDWSMRYGARVIGYDRSDKRCPGRGRVAGQRETMGDWPEDACRLLVTSVFRQYCIQRNMARLG